MRYIILIFYILFSHMVIAGTSKNESSLLVWDIALNPERMFERIDSLEKTGTMPEYKLNYLRCYDNYSMSRFNLAYKAGYAAMGSPEIKKDRDVLNRTMILLLENAVLCGRLEEASVYIASSLDYAKKIKDEVLEANLIFIEGLLFAKIDNFHLCYEKIKYAVSVIDKYTDIGSKLRVSQMLGYLCEAYIAGLQPDMAWDVSRQREMVLNQLRVDGQSLNLVDRQEAHFYSSMAYLSELQGRSLAADNYYKKFKETEFSSSTHATLEINDYFLKIGRYDDVIRNNEKFFIEVDMEDTMSTLYQRALIQSAKAYSEVGNYKWAFIAYDKLHSIKTRLSTEVNKKVIAENIEASAVFKYKQELLGEQINQNNANIRFLILAVFTLIVLVFTVWMVYDRNILKKKNKKIASLLLKNENAMKMMENVVDPSAVDNSQQASDVTVSGFVENDKLFRAFDKKVKEDKLYLKYHFQRDDYMRVMGVDRNRFSLIIKECTGGGNLNSYLNDMRLEHALKLLRVCPDFSIQQVGEASALPSTTTFYRLFREKYGISPKSYRDHLSDGVQNEDEE